MVMSLSLFSQLTHARTVSVEPYIEIKACLPINQETLSVLPEGKATLANFTSFLSQFKSLNTVIRLDVWRGKPLNGSNLTYYSFDILQNGEKNLQTDPRHRAFENLEQGVSPLSENLTEASDQIEENRAIVRDLVGEQLFGMETIHVTFLREFNFPNCAVQITASLRTREPSELCEPDSRQCHFVCDVQACRAD